MGHRAGVGNFMQKKKVTPVAVISTRKYNACCFQFCVIVSGQIFIICIGFWWNVDVPLFFGKREFIRSLYVVIQLSNLNEH